MPLLFSFPGYEDLTQKLQKKLNYNLGHVTIRHFPDGESFVQLLSPVQGKDLFIVCGLENPDTKIMSLLFFSNLVKEMGAKSITLVAPYLGYMRQDKQFHEGESITSKVFAKLLSQHIDRLITIDPHLHRYKSLSEIYSIPATALHATEIVARWIQENIERPLLIGPDSESKQWVSEVAKFAKAPYLILQKIRHGDKNVEVSVPNVEMYKTHTPVLVDDIISTGHTMMETIKHLKAAGMKTPVCVGVHGIFAEGAYDDLEKAGATQVLTCNTVPHRSNTIDISDLIAECLKP